MRKVNIIIVSIVFLLIGSIGYANESKNINSKEKTEKIGLIEDCVTQVYKKIQLHWGSMYKVWPGLNYENHNLLLFKLDNDDNIEKIWLINTKEKREVLKEEVKRIEAPMVFGYSEIEFQGKPSIMMSIDDSVLKTEGLSYEFIYDIATHELVHFYYQPESSLKFQGDRGTQYPIDYEPRLFRKMIILNLCKAFETKDKEKEKYLSKAKYWLEKWKSEYKDEYKAIQNTDIVEGSVKYIECFGTIIKANITPEELERAIKLKLPSDIFYLSVDAESYTLGYIAGVLLDISYLDWKNKYYENNKTPVDILLDRVKPIEEVANKEEENNIKKLVKERNQEIALEIEDIVKAQKNIEIPYLKIKESYMSGSFSTEGFYSYKNQSISSNVSCTFKINNQKIVLKDISVINVKNDNKEYMLIPLLSGYNENGDALEVNNSKINGSATIKKIIENDGRVVFLID